MFRPLDLIPLHRSRRSQGRRPYEPSVRRDGRRFARPRAEAGKSGRETVGALKARGKLGVVVMAEAFDPAVLLPLREKVAGEA